MNVKDENDLNQKLA